VYLPAIVTDAYTDTHTRGAEANAGARLVVIVAASFDVLLAGSIVVRIAVALLDNHAPRSTGSVATAGVIANQAHVASLVNTSAAMTLFANRTPAPAKSAILIFLMGNLHLVGNGTAGRPTL
jgi:hypothetical protein